MKYLDLENWNRKQLFDHFRTLQDPSFGVVVNVNVTKALQYAKQNNISFFVVYLHKCLKALNSVENFKYRIENNKVTIYDTINASATIARPDTTFGFSYFEFTDDLMEFNNRFQSEKERIINSTDLFPPTYSLGCIHCSALPWLNFTGHKEPVSGNKNDSVPQLAFGKIKEENSQQIMPVAITVNHALVDGYHVGLFFEEFQNQLDKID